MTVDRQRSFHFKNAEEHLERQRQELDRASLDLTAEAEGAGPAAHLPVELHQDIARWFRKLGAGEIPAPMMRHGRDDRPVAVVLDREIVAWFRARGHDPEAQIALVLREFMRSVDAAEQAGR